MVEAVLRDVQVHDKRIDLAWEDGIWVAFGKDLDLKGKVEYKGSDLFLLPNVYDAHVHLNDPGRTSWENVSTGTKALARGGVTLYTDMPLNSSPVTTNRKALELKKEAAK